MAVDAKVSQVDELTAYAGKMQGFMESVSSNCTALNNLMVQKLDSLRKKLKQAEQMEREAISDYNEWLQTLAKTPDKDVEGKRALLAQQSYLENRKLCAQRMRSNVASQVHIAQGTTSVIIESTKSFQNKLRINVDKGQTFIKKSVGQLEQYKESKKKL